MKRTTYIVHFRKLWQFYNFLPQSLFLVLRHILYKYFISFQNMYFLHSSATSSNIVAFSFKWSNLLRRPLGLLLHTSSDVNAVSSVISGFNFCFICARIPTNSLSTWWFSVADVSMYLQLNVTARCLASEIVECHVLICIT